MECNIINLSHYHLQGGYIFTAVFLSEKLWTDFDDFFWCRVTCSLEFGSDAHHMMLRIQYF